MPKTLITCDCQGSMQIDSQALAERAGLDVGVPELVREVEGEDVAERKVPEGFDQLEEHHQ